MCPMCFAALLIKDTTLAALATHLGLELPMIGFGAFLVFELHSDGDTHWIKTYYNATPTEETSYSRLKSLALPLGEERLVKVRNCATGSVTLGDFASHCEIPGVEEAFQSFLSLCCDSGKRPTRKALTNLLQNGAGSLKWMSFGTWQERYGEAFRCIDKNNDGKLSCSEVQSALSEWGYSVSRETLERLFRLVDSDPEHDGFDEEDLHLTMSALVGIRGGLHGQSIKVEA